MRRGLQARPPAAQRSIAVRNGQGLEITPPLPRQAHLCRSPLLHAALRILLDRRISLHVPHHGCKCRSGVPAGLEHLAALAPNEDRLAARLPAAARNWDRASIRPTTHMPPSLVEPGLRSCCPTSCLQERAAWLAPPRRRLQARDRRQRQQPCAAEQAAAAAAAPPALPAAVAASSVPGPVPRVLRERDYGALDKSQFSLFVQFFRQASPYIEGHRGRTFVLAIPGEVRCCVCATVCAGSRGSPWQHHCCCCRTYAIPQHRASVPADNLLPNRHAGCAPAAGRAVARVMHGQACITAHAPPCLTGVQVIEQKDILHSLLEDVALLHGACCCCCPTGQALMSGC